MGFLDNQSYSIGRGLDFYKKQLRVYLSLLLGFASDAWRKKSPKWWFNGDIPWYKVKNSP